MNGQKERPAPPRPFGRGRAGGRHSVMLAGPKAKDFTGAIKKLIRYIGGYKPAILAVWLLAAASTVFVVVGPKILMLATDEIYTGVMKQIAGTGGIDFARIGEVILLLTGLYAVSAGFSFTQGYIMTGVTMKVTYRLRKELGEKLHRLPFSYYDTTAFGDLQSRITNDVDIISQTLNQSLTQIITTVATMLGVLIMILTISWKLTVVTLFILPLSMLIATLIIKNSQKYFSGQQEFLGLVNGHIEEMFGSHVVVKAFNGEKESLRVFAGLNNQLFQSAWKANFFSGMMMPITAFIGNIAYVAICVLGGYFTAAGLMTVGGILAFIQYVRTFTQPIAQLASISTVLQRTAAAAERVFELLEEVEETPDAPGALTVKQIGARKESVNAVPVKGWVSFEHVAFGYKPEMPVIRDFCAQIKPGQKVAIVGPTGAGKTTAVKLLMRFYDVTGGVIKIDGIDIRSFRRNELRSLFGMVLQDAWLFNGSIADNIRYAKPGARNEEVWKAARAAQVEHFARALPEGYNMLLNEEADNVSQGQKQLLTIARGFLADPAILILDEATSSVDTHTEVLIQKAMANLMKGRTSFVIAHRLSTIRDADLILVMRDGDIVEQGTHRELLEADGFYATLYNSQFV